MAANSRQSRRAAIQQVLNTLPPLMGTLYLMYLLLPVSYPLVLLLSPFAAGFLIRTFILQHDCGHGSFFKSRKANDRLGLLCSLLTMVPYYYWRRQHALHHATSGNLDQRGHGDLEIFTVEEYRQLSPWRRFRYRAYRNPIVFLLLGPPLLFLWLNRIVLDHQQSTRRQRRNVYLTNVAVAGMLAALGLWTGFRNLFLVATPVLYIAGGVGIWLFYIQHQFEHAYWKRGNEWNRTQAAIAGSSYYKLPRLLQWFTGNIGFHHLHHLDESTPNYCLEQIQRQHPGHPNVHTITLKSSLKTAFLSVWDEQQERLISFRELRILNRLSHPEKTVASA